MYTKWAKIRQNIGLRSKYWRVVGGGKQGGDGLRDVILELMYIQYRLNEKFIIIPAGVQGLLGDEEPGGAAGQLPARHAGGCGQSQGGGQVFLCCCCST